MAGDIGAIIGAGITTGAGLYTNAQNINMQRETNSANASMAREQMAFQERMASTAYQRAAKDMEAAGLNRILAATQGAAPSPQGASSTSVAPRSNLGGVIQDGINTGASLANLTTDLEMKKSATAKTLVDTLASAENARLTNAQARGVDISNIKQAATQGFDIEKSRYESTRAASESARALHEASRSKTAAQAEKADLPRAVKQSEFDADAVKYDSIINRISSGLDAVTSALNVGKYLRTPTVNQGSKAEDRWLNKVGRKGLTVKGPRP